jgi:diacylglycerol kinase family enzyme
MNLQCRFSRGRGSFSVDQVSKGQRVPIGARLWAIASLLAGALLVVLVIVFVLHNGAAIAGALVGLVVGIAGAWWAVTKRMPRRAVGIAGTVLGVGLLALSVLAAGQEDWASVVRFAVAVVLLAITVGAAQIALASYLRGGSAAVVRRAPAPSHPVLLCNPWSGGGKVGRFGLAEVAASLGVETVMLDHGLDLEELARSAVGRGADCLGMAGGDGSQALVASIAVEHHIPFVCVSAGTRNHFALDLCLDRRDPRKSVYAFRDAVERRVDYATVNGRFFVNNVSLGIYATIVQEEGYREAKKETTKRLLPEMLGDREQPFDLQFVTPDGEEVDGAFLIQVSNNPYVLGPSLDVSERRRLDTGRLGVIAVRASTGGQAAEVVTRALAGRSSAGDASFQFECDEFEVRSRSGKAFAGIDGEALELETPLVFRSHPRGLQLLVPEGNIERSLRREARDARPRDLVALALGRPASGFAR